MKPPTVLGIDPGKAGGLVLLVGEEHMQIAVDAEMKPGVKWEAVADRMAGHVRTMHATYSIDLAVLELYGGRAGEGRGSMLTIGVGWGFWRGVLAGLRILTLTPTPATWQKAMLADLPGDTKERSIALASMRVPSLELTWGRRTKPHDGLADAACLALYGRSRGRL